MIYTCYGVMLTWVRSPNSLNNFETLKDCRKSLGYREALLTGRLTEASDFFAREGGRKKNKKVFRRSKKYF
jgi:hypothetical protein